MDLSKIVDPKSLNTGLVLSAILAIIGVLWKKRMFLASKIKSVALFLHLPEVKVYFSDICQRVLQTQKPTNSQRSLQDYIQRFRLLGNNPSDLCVRSANNNTAICWMDSQGVCPTI